VIPEDFQRKGKRNLAADTQWVYDNLPFRLSDVDLSTCPSSGAYALLQWAQLPSNVADFYRIWSKLLPTKQQHEGDPESLDSDATVQIEFITQIERARRVALGEEDADGKVVDSGAGAGVRGVDAERSGAGNGGVGRGPGLHDADRDAAAVQVPARAAVPEDAGPAQAPPGDREVALKPEDW